MGKSLFAILDVLIVWPSRPIRVFDFKCFEVDSIFLRVFPTVVGETPAYIISCVDLETVTTGAFFRLRDSRSRLQLVAIFPNSEITHPYMLRNLPV